ncbi:MAG: transposase [Thermoplasmata archaeon]|nr:transposase [Thermoplasmata archaeon]
MNLESSMELAKYLSYLGDEGIPPELDKAYKVPRGKETYPREAMFLASVYRSIKGIRYFTRFEMHLKENPDVALTLGFKLDNTGEVKIPSHKTLWHFENVRLKEAGLINTLTWQIQKLKDYIEKAEVAKGYDCRMGRSPVKAGEMEFRHPVEDEVFDKAEDPKGPLGRTTGIDSTPLELLRNDPDGAYNPHYKKYMAKVHIAFDLNYLVPLNLIVTGGVESDGVVFIPLISGIERMHGKGFLKDTYVDGAYPSSNNIARAEVQYGVHLHYRINKNWKHEKGFRHQRDKKPVLFTPEEEINFQYNKMWKDESYNPKATLEEKMRSLVGVGKVEPVAMYFRNRACRSYDENPKTYLADCSKRSVHEGMNGILKDHYNLMTNFVSKGLNRASHHVLKTLVAMLSVALVRAKHGITENLTSTAYLV